MLTFLITSAGWMGVGLVVVAYALVSSGRIQATSTWFQLMNLLGALGVGIQSYSVDAFPSVLLQIIWGTIALVSIFRIFRK